MNNMTQALSHSILLAGQGESIKVDFLHTKKASLILRAINHPLRQQMIKLLDEHSKMTVTEIYIKLRLEQSVASQHLAILRRAGIVQTSRDGKFIFYGLSYPRLREIITFIEQLVS